MDDVFVDFGSGKGRMVYIATHSYPFKKVIGVDISELPPKLVQFLWQLMDSARIEIIQNVSLSVIKMGSVYLYRQSIVISP